MDKPQHAGSQNRKSPLNASIPANPFTFGNPIQEPDRFYGRKAEIRQIVNRLLSSAHESTSITGERRIGKTSLLKYLASPDVAAEMGLSPDKYCLIYVDFQGLTDITPQRFWQRVLGKMAQSVCDESMKLAIQKLTDLNEFDLFDLEDVFEKSREHGLTIILFMDEFEYVTQNQNFGSDFFGGLRALAIHHGVALIPATQRELVDLCHSEEIKGSPFFNIFANVVLRPFSKEDVDKLLDDYASRSKLTLDSGEHAIIWDLAGGYPFFVQMAGYYLIEGREQGLSGEGLANFVNENFFQQADSHYSYLWGRSTESEKIALLTLLTLAGQKPSKRTLPNLENLARIRSRIPKDLAALGKRGLVYDTEGAYHIFSPSFDKWIRNEILATPGEEESRLTVDQWLKSDDRRDFKDTRKLLPHIKKKYWGLVAELFKDFSIDFAVVGVFEIIKFSLGIR